ncbi:MAG: disulfide oxidoreductase [Patescibacteria group bacterium]
MNVVVYLALIQALLATLTSLFFSEVMKFPPCVLCWYQRICLYPVVIILLVGILRKNKDIHLYVLPLTLIGEAIAIYHNLLYYKIIPESIAPCINGVSCTTKFIEFFGFITIPFLSLVAFSVINICMIIYMLNARKTTT